MIKEIQFQITPEEAVNEQFLHKKIKNDLGISHDDFKFQWKKRSIDARKAQIKINGTFEVFIKEEIPAFDPEFHPKDVTNATVSVAIVGAGPAGLYAALRCLELGLKPVVYERGKDVRSRRRDLAKLNKEMVVNPESNYCFGEGGAGTYSDGKLYTRSKKRGDVLKSLKWFVHFGAERDIIVDAHPHIGTNKLPHIIVSMREEIIKWGGEVHFDTKVTDFLVEKNQIKGLELNHTQTVAYDHVILATGHSARDIFELLHKRNIKIEAKPFALGVRIEHTQEVIDTIQYHGRLNDEFVPPASYS